MSFDGNNYKISSTGSKNANTTTSIAGSYSSNANSSIFNGGAASVPSLQQHSSNSIFSGQTNGLDAQQRFQTIAKNGSVTQEEYEEENSLRKEMERIGKSKEAGEKVKKLDKKIKAKDAEIKKLKDKIKEEKSESKVCDLKSQLRKAENKKRDLAKEYNDAVSDYKDASRTSILDDERLFYMELESEQQEDPKGWYASLTEGEKPSEGRQPVNIGGEVNESKAAQIANAAEKQASSMGSTGKCYSGVYLGMKNAGYDFFEGESAYMAADQIAARSDFTEITSQIPTGEDLKSLPKGAIVVWSQYNGGIHGHISVALGDGREASDHVQAQITSMGGTSGKYRVFMPR